MTSFQDFPILGLGYSSLVAPISDPNIFQNCFSSDPCIKWPISQLPEKAESGYIGQLICEYIGQLIFSFQKLIIKITGMPLLSNKHQTFLRGRAGVHQKGKKGYSISWMYTTTFA